MEVIENNEMKTGTKVFLGVLASAILVGGLGALTRGFTNWDPDTWLDQWQTEDPEDSDEEDTKVEGEKLEMLMKGGPKFASRAVIGDTKTVTATIKNADAAMDKRIKWESSDSTKISVGKATTNSGEANTVSLVKYFSGTVTISAYPYLGDAGDGATIEVTYENLVQSLEGGVVIYDETGVGFSDPSGIAGLKGYFESEVTDFTTDLGWGDTAVKKSQGFNDYYIYYEASGKAAISIGGEFATGNETLAIILKGTGQEGCDTVGIEEGDHGGKGTLTCVTNSTDMTGGSVYVGVDGNEAWIAIRITAQYFASTLKSDMEFRYEVGDASYEFTAKKFVYASGVDVSSPTITF